MSESEKDPPRGPSTVVVPPRPTGRNLELTGDSDPALAGPHGWIGKDIGDYHVLRVIDAGGMGVVFLAQQRHPKRLVAIKTLHAGLHQPEMLARFQQEAEILGRLKHPGIAQIFASGRTDASLGLVPYIIMEYVEGAALLDYCAGISVRARLSILMRVCTAVEHAHIRGVIHRDLKPGNILVQADGEPKVLDFGVARLSGEDQAGSELTTAGMVVGTIAYMSPEQSVGEIGGVDIRTDVYALGMIGYRMLSGALPYEVSNQSMALALTQICETPPKPLSRHGAEFAGDLETIFAKALTKDKESRYQNVAELSEDLRRYLADEAILARRPSALSELRRFTRRNKVLVGAAAVVLFALVGAVAVSTRFALDEQAQRRQTDASLRFMGRIFSSANPVFAQGREVRVRDVMQHGVDDVERELSDAPEARARMRVYFAETYKALGDLPLALELYRSAAADFAKAGIGGPEYILARIGQSRALMDSGRTREARDLLQSILQGAAPTQATTWIAQLHLAVAQAQMGEDAAARSNFDQGLAQLAAHPGQLCEQCGANWQSRLTVWSLAQRAQFERRAGNLDAAKAAAEAAVAAGETGLDESDPDRLIALINLSLVQAETGDTAAARALLQTAYDDRVRLLKAEHWQSLSAANNLALALVAEGKTDAAEALFRQSLAVGTRSLDALHPELSTLKANLGNLLHDKGEYTEAESLLANAYADRVQRLGPSHPATLTNALNLAVLYTKLQKFDLAKPLMEAALDGTEARFGEANRQTIAVRSEFASFLRDRGSFAAADAMFEQAWRAAKALLPPGDSDRLRVLYQYSGSLQKQQRFAEAEAISAELMSESGLAKSPKPPHAVLAPARHARSLMGLKRYGEAEKLLLALDAELQGPSFAQMRRITRDTLAELYRADGQPGKADLLSPPKAQ